MASRNCSSLIDLRKGDEAAPPPRGHSVMEHRRARTRHEEAGSRHEDTGRRSPSEEDDVNRAGQTAGSDAGNDAGSDAENDAGSDAGNDAAWGHVEKEYDEEEPTEEGYDEEANVATWNRNGNSNGNPIAKVKAKIRQGVHAGPLKRRKKGIEVVDDSDSTNQLDADQTNQVDAHHLNDITNHVSANHVNAYDNANHCQEADFRRSLPRPPSTFERRHAPPPPPRHRIKYDIAPTFLAPAAPASQSENNFWHPDAIQMRNPDEIGNRGVWPDPTHDQDENPDENPDSEGTTQDANLEATEVGNRVDPRTRAATRTETRTETPTEAKAEAKSGARDGNPRTGARERWHSEGGVATSRARRRTSGIHMPTSGVHMPTSGVHVPASGGHVTTSGVYVATSGHNIKWEATGKGGFEGETASDPGFADSEPTGGRQSQEWQQRHVREQPRHIREGPPYVRDGHAHIREGQRHVLSPESHRRILSPEEEHHFWFHPPTHWSQLRYDPLATPRSYDDARWGYGGYGAPLYGPPSYGPSSHGPPSPFFSAQALVPAGGNRNANSNSAKIPKPNSVKAAPPMQQVVPPQSREDEAAPATSAGTKRQTDRQVPTQLPTQLPTQMERRVPTQVQRKQEGGPGRRPQDQVPLTEVGWRRSGEEVNVEGRTPPGVAADRSEEGSARGGAAKEPNDGGVAQKAGGVEDGAAGVNRQARKSNRIVGAVDDANASLLVFVTSLALVTGAWLGFSGRHQRMDFISATPSPNALHPGMPRRPGLCTCAFCPKQSGGYPFA